MIHVAVGIIFNDKNEILVAERQKNKHQGGTWEFPGGKIEKNETVFAALTRELHEEIGISVVAAEAWQQFPYEYADKQILLDVWLVKNFLGLAIGKEGQSIRWVSLPDLLHLNIPDANRVIVAELSLRVGIVA